jgi:hypothetical protein
MFNIGKDEIIIIYFIVLIVGFLYCGDDKKNQEMMWGGAKRMKKVEKIWKRVEKSRKGQKGV